ncbi:MAG: CCA tRNA nucleotidyltransferase [Phycisphaerae bacterium]|nr:CCA tRNA nucleotidyltransferase [Phycisphaerae bacterium]
MTPDSPLGLSLAPSADAAVTIVRRLREAGHEAMLNGGCVRDLLLGVEPQDYDIATGATPEQIRGMFRATREVGAQFGVMLVRAGGRWIEVATFRTDGDYRDGRRPEQVMFSDARQDALRRDFTVNGMFLDPIAMRVIDYVGGQSDLAARVIRAIGEPRKRFEEDYLRLLRAVRFAARLGFAIEAQTAREITLAAAKVAQVAAERVREELEKMLSHPSRATAIRLIVELGLLPHLWPGADGAARTGATCPPEAMQMLGALPGEAGFVAGFACLVREESQEELERIARHLTFSNEDREALKGALAARAALREPATVRPAVLKRLMASAVWPTLHDLMLADYSILPDGAMLAAQFAARVAAIPADEIAPKPLISGHDVLARGVPAGPAVKPLMDQLYDEQLDGTLRDRAGALRRLEELTRDGGKG